MNPFFGYPKYSTLGERVLTDTEGIYRDMMMNISVLQMKAGEVKKLRKETEEMAILLLSGSLVYQWQGETRKAERRDCFCDKGFCLHVPKGVAVTLSAEADCEVLVQTTENDGTFAGVFYTPEQCREDVFGQEVPGNTAIRTVRTFFDYDNAPYSNMVLGEVVSAPGGWSGFLPHSHRQPEVYYYRFDHPNGFGGCFIGEEVFKATDGSFCAIPGGAMHPQVAAPGYRMFYVWMIRHLDGDPWTDRVLDPKHTWMLEKE